MLSVGTYMLKFLAYALVLTCLVSSTGCLTQQVATDGRNFRQALLGMYEEQAMDNLVRACENRPFVQLAYRNLIVTDTQFAKANVSNEYDPTKTKTISLVTSALLVSMRQFTDKLLFGGSVERDRTMQFQADPVTGSTEVYDYYQAFARDPELFTVSSCEPPCPVHIKKKCGDKWYWVPAEAGGVYLQLVLKTAFMRGPETPPPIYWPTAIESIVMVGPILDPKTKDVLANRYEITLSQPVPNDRGGDLSHLYVPMDDCRMIKFNVEHNLAVTSKFVTALRVQYTGPLDLNRLKGRAAKFYSPDHLPPNPNASPEQQRLEAVVEAYRRNVNQPQ